MTCHRPCLFAARMALCALAFFLATEAMAKDNAGIFFFGPPPPAEQVAAAAHGADTSIVRDGRYTRIEARWPDVTLQITIDPQWNREVQFAGMRRWIGQFDAETRSTPTVTALLAGLDHTTTCFGSSITPAFDRDGKVAATLLRLLQPSGGFFFVHQSFYDAEGKRIIGLPGDPDRLGPRD